MATVSEVKGVGPVTEKALAAEGFKTAKQLAKAKAADIVVVSGVGETRASMLIAAAQALISAANAVAEPSGKKASGGKKKKKKGKKIEGKKAGGKKAKGADKKPKKAKAKKGKAKKKSKKK